MNSIRHLSWRALRPVACAALVATLAACASGPDYQRPTMDVPSAFKEAEGWQVTQPADLASPGPWWSVYGDAQLDQLVAQVALNNQTVSAAEASVRQAQAALGAADAAYLPTVSADASSTRSRSSANGNNANGNQANGQGGRVTTSHRVALSANWEIDLWGRLRRGAEAGRAEVQASQADLQAALLSAQSALVESYLQLRVNEAQQALMKQSLENNEKAVRITRNRFDAGVADRADVLAVESQWQATQAQAIDLRAQRAQLEHAMALLVGKAPAQFSLPVTGVVPALPGVPLALPATLLQRRPDIAAAERRVASANAQIGVAQAAFFPALTLGASTGFQSNTWSQILTAPNRIWSVGPALAATLFDGGARQAQKDQTVAAYDRTVAQYREAVLTGFQEVEDSLATLAVLKEEAEVQRQANASAQESLQLTLNQYQAGTVGLLNVLTSQTSALAQSRTVLDLAGRRLVASASLLKALGGGWEDPPRQK
ncbi:efflux transporter outer membrane subunit [Aquabacterium sp.]|uniref:efflux transporter outer membrane subunit n=1 Tax=Aquabacterium sp. TaxID=1872578 RepID=UPI003D6C7131